MPPLKRRDELIVRQVADETLVYDERNDRAHCLNRVAAVVWEQCDGRTSPEEIADFLNGHLGIPSDIDVVRLAIRKLDRSGLLDSGVDRQEMKGVSRRELTRRLGLAAGAAVVLPLVISIIAPTPLMAASCVPRNGICGESQGGGQGTPCCAGLQCNNNRCT
jgi:hypothetical protein